MNIKNTKLISILAVIILGFISIFAINLNSVVTTYKNSEFDIGSEKIILIDPGHGGIDGGASSKDGTAEKNINLNIGLLLGANLKSQGYKVEFTRSEDVGLYTEGKPIKEMKYEDLNRRVALKNETKCDMFVSIHLNAFPQANCKGAQVWYSDYKDSAKLASVMQSTLKSKLDPSNKREAKAAGSQYKVLRGNDDMPGVIVECGFLSNPEECDKLKTEDYQQMIANALSESISIYLENREN
ncbi:MAG: N-acetylmuramoyl-L-alanine amidase CwlD [Clostridium sp.]|uniref:N-acetylmuramoyl-L-alanine amidase CwlD n=1 Tax=Clostridium sp. TaxID=1506 RepID=UPI00305AA058